MVTQSGRVTGAPSEFADDVLEVVDTIPEGKVMTYGDIAELLGRGGARGVGNVMARYGSDVPWWRVIRSGGYFPQGLEDEALAHYREEGTPLVRGRSTAAGRPGAGALAGGEPRPAARPRLLSPDWGLRPRRCVRRPVRARDGGAVTRVGRGWWDERVLTPAPRPERGGRGAAARRRPAGCARPPRRSAARARRPGHRQDHHGRSRPWSRRVESGEADARPVPHPHLLARRGRQPARARHGAARRHLDRAAGAHPPGPRVRHPAPGGRAARRPDAAAAQRARAGRHPARAAGRPRRARAPAPTGPSGSTSRCGTRGFRGELRDLLMRAVEHDLEPADLARLGREHDRPEWVAAARRAGRVRRGHRAAPRPAPTTRPGSSAPRPTCSRTTPTALGAAASTGCGSWSSTTPRSSPPPRLGCCARMATPGLDLVLLGDPDSAVQTFRGADPRHLSDGWTQLATSGEPRTLVLPTAYRLPQAVVDAAAQGRAQDRRPRRRPPARCRGRARRRPASTCRLLRAVSQEASYVAARAARGAPAVGIPWSRDGRHRARAGPHRDPASGADGRGRAGRRDRDRPAGARRGGRAPAAGAARGGPRPGPRCRRRRSTPRWPSTPCCPRSVAPTRSGCAGCAARCAGSSSRTAGGAPATSCSPRPSSCPAALIELGPEAASRAPGGRHHRRRGRGARRASWTTRGPALAWRWEPGVSAESVLWAMWAATGLGAEWQATRPRRRCRRGARRPRPRRRGGAVRRRGQVRRPAAAGRPRGVPHPHRQPGHPRRHPRRAVAGGRVGHRHDPPGRRRSRVAPRRRRGRAGGRLARPAAAGLAAGFGAPGRRRVGAGDRRSGPRRPRCATTRRGRSSSP